jgi:hypothetical protein
MLISILAVYHVFCNTIYVHNNPFVIYNNDSIGKILGVCHDTGRSTIHIQ